MDEQTPTQPMPGADEPQDTDAPVGGDMPAEGAPEVAPEDDEEKPAAEGEAPQA